jgi:LuxR family maltose regulon positive regulatory protein
MLQSSIGAQALTLFRSPQPLPVESVLSLLLNDLDAFREPLCLVLDDFHVIESTAIQRGLDNFLAHMPAHMHLVISSRADAPLSLARLRAGDQLVELRAADLRFTVEEASAFLTQVMGLRLAPEQVALLETRTEGWIAGLQMAALSMQGRDDVSAFIAEFTGVTASYWTT